MTLTKQERKSFLVGFTAVDSLRDKAEGLGDEVNPFGKEVLEKLREQCEAQEFSDRYATKAVLWYTHSDIATHWRRTGNFCQRVPDRREIWFGNFGSLAALLPKQGVASSSLVSRFFFYYPHAGFRWMNLMMLTLSEIKAEVESRAVKIGAEASMLPTFGIIRGDATPCIEVTPTEYHYIVSERGNEYRRDTTQEMDELLFLIFCDITSQVASNYEMRHRLEDQDSRRLWFSHQEELLFRLSHEWAARVHEQHERLVQERPYDDNRWLRAKSRAEYMKAGYSIEAAWKMACEKSPLPKPQNEP